jgi:hypothetical protein
MRKMQRGIVKKNAAGDTAARGSKTTSAAVDPAGAGDINMRRV